MTLSTGNNVEDVYQRGACHVIITPQGTSQVYSNLNFTTWLTAANVHTGQDGGNTQLRKTFVIVKVLTGHTVYIASCIATTESNTPDLVVGATPWQAIQ